MSNEFSKRIAAMMGWDVPQLYTPGRVAHISIPPADNLLLQHTSARENAVREVLSEYFKEYDIETLKLLIRTRDVRIEQTVGDMRNERLYADNILLGTISTTLEESHDDIKWVVSFIPANSEGR